MTVVESWTAVQVSGGRMGSVSVRCLCSAWRPARQPGGLSLQSAFCARRFNCTYATRPVWLFWPMEPEARAKIPQTRVDSHLTFELIRESLHNSFWRNIHHSMYAADCCEGRISCKLVLGVLGKWVGSRFFAEDNQFVGAVLWYVVE